MSPPERGLFDTSIFTASGSARPVDARELPSAVAVSVVTVAELHLGVLAATGDEVRARRLATLGRRLNVNDLRIASTALTHGLPVVTQDGDFDAVAGIAGLVVIRA